MKRILFIALGLVFLASLCFAGGVQDAVRAVIAKKGGACGGGETYGYSNFSGAIAANLSDASTQLVGMYTNTCTGYVAKAKLRHIGTDSQTAKVLIYLDDGDNVPDAGDSLVTNCVSATISSNTDAEIAEGAFTGCSITKDSVYWLAIAPGTVWRAAYVAGDVKSHYDDTCESFDTQESNLGVCGWLADANRKFLVQIVMD